jgi:hypothetical protein
MDPMPGSAAACQPREWLALPGGGIRRVVSVLGRGGAVELIAHAAWQARLASACPCGRPRLGSGRTCGSAECVARLRGRRPEPLALITVDKVRLTSASPRSRRW